MPDPFDAATENQKGPIPCRSIHQKDAGTRSMDVSFLKRND